MSSDKSKVTLWLDSKLVRVAKSKRINLSKASEEGIKMKLAIDVGKPYTMMSEDYHHLSEVYKQYFMYRIRLMNNDVQYTSNKGIVWIESRALTQGWDPRVLINRFERVFNEEMRRRKEQGKLCVSEEGVFNMLKVYKAQFENVKSYFNSMDRYDTRVRDWAKARFKHLGNFITFSEFLSFLLGEREVVREEALVPIQVIEDIKEE